MKNRVTALLLSFAMALGLAACGAASADDRNSGPAAAEAFSPRLDTGEEVTVNVVGPLNNFESLEAVISDFEEIYPNCHVLYSQLDMDMLAARLHSDASVGIFMLNCYRYQGASSLPGYCADLLQEDLDLSAVRETALKAVTVDGKLFGLPAAQKTNGLIVNVSLLEKAGLSVPKTYSELLSACRTLKEQGYTPLQGYEASADGYSYMYKSLAQNMFHVLLTEELDEGRNMDAFYEGQSGSASFLQPVFEKIAALIDNGYTDPEVNRLYTDIYNDAILRFFEGDVPFLVTDAETYSGTRKRESKSDSYRENPFEYCFICTPLADDGAYVYMENWWNFCLNEEGENKEWALEFLRFLATGEELNQLASIKGLPSVAADSSDERYADLYPENEALLKFQSYVIPAAVEDALAMTLTELSSGQIEVAEVAGELERLLRESAAEPEAETAS